MVNLRAFCEVRDLGIGGHDQDWLKLLGLDVRDAQYPDLLLEGLPGLRQLVARMVSLDQPLAALSPTNSIFNSHDT